MGDLPMWKKWNVLKEWHDKARWRTIQETGAQRSVWKDIGLEGERGLKNALERRQGQKTHYPLGVSKKTEKLIKPRKLEKKITEKTEPKKKPIKILKNPVGSVRFRFYKQKTEKTEPNRNR